MRTARAYLAGTAAIAAVVIGVPATLFAQQAAAPPSAASAQPAVQINASAIGGVVTSRFGPEAGVWVIAETTDLTSKFAKIVVTDERGRYVVPDLPAANYKVWVRGYGLVDSPKVDAKPGANLNLTAVIAPTAKDAAQYYPPMYWYSMVKIPDVNQFPTPGANPIRTQGQYIDMTLFNGCGNCHQLGNYTTRTIPSDLAHLSVAAAWDQRVQQGQAGRNMVTALAAHRASRAAVSSPRWSTGPPVSRRANIPAPRRRVRPASSGTWSSPCAIGAIRRCTCTT